MQFQLCEEFQKGQPGSKDEITTLEEGHMDNNNNTTTAPGYLGLDTHQKEVRMFGPFVGFESDDSGRSQESTNLWCDKSKKDSPDPLRSFHGIDDYFKLLFRRCVGHCKIKAGLSVEQTVICLGEDRTCNHHSLSGMVLVCSSDIVY